jgi:hypothetical protein
MALLSMACAVDNNVKRKHPHLSCACYFTSHLEVVNLKFVNITELSVDPIFEENDSFLYSSALTKRKSEKE